MCPEEGVKKVCRHCRSKIHADAGVCKYCQRSQNRARNGLLFLASIVGFLSLVGSAYTYVREEIDIRYVQFTVGDKLGVAAFHEGDDAIIVNAGYRPVNVLRAVVKDSKFERDKAYDIHKEVQRGKSVRIRLGKKGVRKNLVPTGEGIFRDNIRVMEFWALNGAEKEVYPLVAANNDPDHLFAKEKWSRKKENKRPWPTEYPCEITIYFIPVGESSERPELIECVSMIYSSLNIEPLTKKIRDFNQRRPEDGE